MKPKNDQQKQIFTGDTLISLPGYRSDVRFDNGTSIKLLGDLPELSLMGWAFESVVLIHEPRDCDVDLTLDHGRIVLTNDRPDRSAKVRVRFANPTVRSGQDYWEITLLEKGTSVALELWGRYLPDTRFTLDRKKHLGPQSLLSFFMLKGQVLVRTDNVTRRIEGPPGALPSWFFWDSEQGVAEPRKIPSPPPWVGGRLARLADDLPKDQRNLQEKKRSETLKALDDLSTSIAGEKLEVGLWDGFKKNPSSVKRVLVVRCFGAVNDLANLIDGLVDKDFYDVRLAAVETLRHWISLHPDNELRLYDFLHKRKDFSAGEAFATIELLHGHWEQDRNQPATYARLIDFLRQNNPANRVLAYWHLVVMVPWGERTVTFPYDPLGSSDQIEKGADAWKRLIPEGSVPKQPKQPMRP
jgi:hypothetical protein